MFHQLEEKHRNLPGVHGGGEAVEEVMAFAEDDVFDVQERDHHGQKTRQRHRTGGQRERGNRLRIVNEIGAEIISEVTEQIPRAGFPISSSPSKSSIK